MDSMPTPNYVVYAETTLRYHWSTDPIVLPAGAFVRPIEYQWVPKHVKDDERFRDYNKEKHIFAYTRHGILMFEHTQIRRAG